MLFGKFATSWVKHMPGIGNHGLAAGYQSGNHRPLCTLSATTLLHYKLELLCVQFIRNLAKKLTKLELIKVMRMAPTKPQQR